jgi:hypothetical protein
MRSVTFSVSRVVCVSLMGLLEPRGFFKGAKIDPASSSSLASRAARDGVRLRLHVRIDDSSLAAAARLGAWLRAPSCESGIITPLRILGAIEKREDAIAVGATEETIKRQ